MKSKFLILTIISLFFTNMNTHAQTTATSKKMLIVYFSHSGNTREIANQIHRITNADIFEIQSIKPYPIDYDKVLDLAKQELKSGYKPALKTKINNLNDYDIVFIGYPNWWNTYPAPVKTFLSEYDLSGKTIVPFCTHEGSGLGRSVSNMKELCSKSIFLEGIAIRGSEVKLSQRNLHEWLQKIKIIE